MKKRLYRQFCALAFALDIIGERWTLLIIRELLAGPRRFKDLEDGLSGISTNLLAERLKSLEQQEIVCRRVLPPPAGASVYELTPLGRALEKSILELGRWGSRFLPTALGSNALPSVGSLALAIKAFCRPERTQAVGETLELHIDNEILQVSVKRGEVQVQQGAALGPDVVLYTDVQSFLGMFTGQTKPDEAISRRLARVEGDRAALNRFFRSCDLSRST